jgi:hypothetical protein
MYWIERLIRNFQERSAPEVTEVNNVTAVTVSRNASAGKVFVLILALAGCAWTIHSWLANFYDVSNDPACYINAADNLVKSGSLFDYGNWVTRTTAPVVEPYTEWPPGTPLFLAPFILVFHDPMVSAVVSKSILIIVAYAALVAVASVLDLNAVFTAALIAVFTFLHPFIISNTQYGSETLFFIFSLAAGYFAIRIVRDAPLKKYWTLGLLFTFLASSVRFTGVANIAWFIPILGPKFAFRKSPDDRLTRIISMILLVAGILILVGSLWVDMIGFFVTYRVDVLHFILLITGCSAFILGLRLMPWFEWRGGDSWIAGGSGWTSRLNLLRFLALAAAFGPVAMWFTRNILMYGVVTRSHGLFTEFNPQGIVQAPLMLCFYMLQNTIVHQTVSFLLLTLLAFTPLIIGGSRERTIGLMLVSATLFQIATMWGASLLATFDYLNGRLLSPTILLAAVTAVFGLSVLYRSNRNNKLKLLLLLLPFMFLATNEHTDFKNPGLLSWKVNYPKEMYLWQRIHKMKWTLQSSQVYTEVNYRHQMFTGIPQKIFWPKYILKDPVLLKKLFSETHRPFLVFPEGSDENRMIRATIRNYDFKVDSVVYSDLGYVLYYEPLPEPDSAKAKRTTG